MEIDKEAEKLEKTKCCMFCGTPFTFPAKYFEKKPKAIHILTFGYLFGVRCSGSTKQEHEILNHAYLVLNFISEPENWHFVLK